MRDYSTICCVLVGLAIASSAIANDPPGRELTAKATMTTSQGTSHTPITLFVARFTSVEESHREGLVNPSAAISVDPSDQSIEIDEYQGEPGTLTNIKRIR